jgi:hypothetical protein
MDANPKHTRKNDMDMTTAGQMPQGEQGEDPKAMLKQAQELIGKALAAMGGEPAGDDRMSVEQAFGKGFQGDEVSPKY